jgi:hypothetical protein
LPSSLCRGIPSTRGLDFKTVSQTVGKSSPLRIMSVHRRARSLASSFGMVRVWPTAHGADLIYIKAASRPAGYFATPSLRASKHFATRPSSGGIASLRSRRHSDVQQGIEAVGVAAGQTPRPATTPKARRPPAHRAFGDRFRTQFGMILNNKRFLLQAQAERIVTQPAILR